MKIELTDKELRMVEWTVMAYLERLEHEQRTEIDNDLWNYLENKWIICKEILKKIEDGNKNNNTRNN